MSEDKEPTMAFNNKTLPFYLGMLSLASAIYVGISSLNAYGYEVEKVRNEQEAISERLTELAQTTKSLDSNLTNFTIAINRIQDRTDVLEKRIEELEKSKRR